MSEPTDATRGVSPFLLVGGAHLDRVARCDVPYRAGASHPGRLGERVGGAVLNAAVALRCFGVAVRLVSARGGDPAAGAVVDELRERGIEDGAVVWLDRQTASYTAILDRDGELIAGVADMAIYDALSVRVLSRSHLRDAVASAPVLLVDANLPLDSLALLAERATGLLAAIAVSPEKVTRLRPVLPRLDLLFLSLAEARALTQSDGSPREIGIALRDRGVRRAVVTDGPRDVTILEGDAILAQGVPRLDALRDVTGAGDTLAAVTLLGVARGTPLRDAVRLGLAASAIRITTGLGPGTPAEARRRAEDLPPATDHPKDCTA